MKSEIFRLNEDEAALVQTYRVLSDDVKAAFLAMLQHQAEQSFIDAQNVLIFAAQIAS